MIKNYSEEFELNEASSKLPFLVGESIAHLELYLELVNELKKVPPGKEIPYMSKIKAETASKSLPNALPKARAYTKCISLMTTNLSIGHALMNMSPGSPSIPAPK